MRPSKWKRFLSYLWELHIESAPSDVNPHLYVSLKSGRYQLSTANAIYSFEDKYDNFFDSFMQLDLNKLPGKKVLILGLGLASIPFMLEKRFLKSFEYTGVEIDQKVIYLASKYVLDELLSSVQIIEADACTYLEMSNEIFDLVIMDVFVDDDIPKEMQQMEFIDLIKKKLHPDGLFMYNRLAYHEKDKAESIEYFETIFQKGFTDASYLQVKGNYMLLNRSDLHL